MAEYDECYECGEIIEIDEKDFWDQVDKDWVLYCEQHPDDERDLANVATSGDWQRWYDNDCKPLS